MKLNLYRKSSIITAIHILAACSIVFILWGKVDTNHLFDWSLFLMFSLLLSSLGQIIFARKRTAKTLNENKWKNIFAASSVLTGLIFTIAYSYSINFGDETVTLLCALIMVMHLACISNASVVSKKVMVGGVVSIVLPVIVVLLLAHNPLNNIVAAGISVFAAIILSLSFSMHRALLKSNEMSLKHKQQIQITEQHKHLLETSTIEDQETQIFNRKFFDLMINEEVRRAKRAGNNLSLAIIEVDCFDEYVEHYGKEKATKCLRTVAKILSNATPRGGEFMTRFDSNKFALIVPNIMTDETIAFTAKMIDLISQKAIEHQHTLVENVHKVTLSIGISEFKKGNIIDVNEIIEQGMYALKTAINVGRNNTQVYAANVLSNNALSHKPREVFRKHTHQKDTSGAA